MKSVWQDSVKMPSFKRLKGDVNTDVLIIGGGMCGVLCAYFLQSKGINYILAEGKTIAGGTTKNTTAKITSLHGLIYDRLINLAGIETAKMYLRSNELAIAKYREIAHGMNCDFEETDAYTYSLTNRRQIENEVNAANRLGKKAEFVKQTPLPFSIEGAVKFSGQAQLNPLKFIAEISKKLNIYEHTFINEIDKNTAIYDGGRIKAGKIIVATHFPFINRHGGYFLKMYQRRSYVIAVSGAENLDGMYIDEAQDGMSFRNYDDLLFIGGGGHKTGKNGGNWRVLREFVKKYYPSANEEFAWAAQDCMSLDAIPYIGSYSKGTQDLYAATGFNKWGMTGSMAAAAVLSDIVTKNESEYSELYNPSRSMALPQLMINAFGATANLLTPSVKRCPHLGCALKWNKGEHTWDCPCHGSRFDENGSLIDNPAMRDAKI